MIKLELEMQRTWYEISQYLNSNDSNPLRIAEIINRVPPCCWTFRFVFDEANRTIVKIDCDSAFPDEDALVLLNGSLEEVFFVDVLSLRQAGKYLSTDISKLLQDPPTSNLITLQDSGKQADYLLDLTGFWQTVMPSKIQERAAIHTYFLEHTWLGSPNFVDSEHYIRWIVLGSEELIWPRNRYETILKSTDSFTAQVTLYDTNDNHIGQASFWTSPLLEADEIYTVFGPLVSKPENWLTRSREGPHWIVEIDSQKLRQAVTQGKPTTTIINELVNSVEDARVSVTDSESFQVHIERIDRKRQTKAANSLQNRQEDAKNRQKIIFKGKPLMLVPSNENEVLVLLCKLEALDALPLHEFTLWAYTARTGIDAIATYRIDEIDVPIQLGAIEVEYQYENFFSHGHPPSQVNLLICWDFRGGKVPAELRQLSEYLFEYQKKHSLITVLVLSKIPNLQF